MSESHPQILEEPSSPQHDKAKLHADEMQAIGEFLEWLPTVDLHLSEWMKYPEYANKVLVQSNTDIQQLLADFYEIDYKAYLAEKDAALAYIRSRNGIT